MVVAQFDRIGHMSDCSSNFKDVHEVAVINTSWKMEKVPPRLRPTDEVRAAEVRSKVQ